MCLNVCVWRYMYGCLARYIPIFFHFFQTLNFFFFIEDIPTTKPTDQFSQLPLIVYRIDSLQVVINHLTIFLTCIIINTLQLHLSKTMQSKDSIHKGVVVIWVCFS